MLNISIDKWIDQDVKEADLLISSDNMEFVAYCSNFFKTGYEDVSLFSLYSNNVFLTHNQESIEKNEQIGGFYSYTVVAQVISILPPRVKLTEDITIELDCPIPGDIHIGQNIQFNTERLSL